MCNLRARLLQHVLSSEGPQADIALIEPNGDEYKVRCLCKSDGTTDLGAATNPDMLGYLNGRYGAQTVSGLARSVTLSSW